MNLFALSVVLLISFLILRRLLGSHFLFSSRRSQNIEAKLPAESRATFLACTFSMLGKLAEEDGAISSDEIERVQHYIECDLKLEGRLRALAFEVFKEASSSPVSFEDYVDEFRKAFPDQVQLSDRLIEILVEVSVADSFFSKAEDQLVRSAALRLGLTEAGYCRIKEKYIRGSRTIH